MGSSIKRIRYRYDSRGNRKALIDQDDGRFTYSYDAVSRITQVINPQGDRTSYSYDAAGRRTVKKLANGTRASLSYDNVGNLTRLANLKSDGTTISSFQYEYDEVGNRTSVLEADGSRVTWSYDDTYQLTGEHRTGSHAYRNTFAYDPAGNRTLKNEDGARTTYSYDAANQLAKAVDASGTTTYTFDEDGNQKVVEAPNGDRSTNTWDGENRMTSVQQPDGTRNTMAYEPVGLRVKLEESTGVKKFIWDGQNYLAETDENDDTQVVYTNEPRVYGNLVSQRRATDSHWYHFDAIGSTRELTDDAETVTDTRLYDAWGSLIANTGVTAAPFAFVGAAGYYKDGDRHATYVRSRILSTRCGRWYSADPMKHIDGLNLYTYVANSPTNIIDPTGNTSHTHLCELLCGMLCQVNPADTVTVCCMYVQIGEYEDEDAAWGPRTDTIVAQATVNCDSETATTFLGSCCRDFAENDFPGPPADALTWRLGECQDDESTTTFYPPCVPLPRGPARWWKPPFGGHTEFTIGLCYASCERCNQRPGLCQGCCEACYNDHVGICGGAAGCLIVAERALQLCSADCND